jgi:preprotein translocase subunit YajC
MNSFLFSLLLGGAQGAEAASGPGAIVNFLPLVAIIAIFYFLIIRPQNKKQKETQKMLSALKKGDRIVTIGGIHGTIQSVKENTVILRVDDTTKLEFSRSAVSSVESQAREEKEEKKTEDKKIEAPAGEKGEDSNEK